MKSKIIVGIRVLALLLVEAIAILYFFGEFPLGEIRAVYEAY